MAANSIVLVNASISVAPAPSTLQETGALISQGATTLAAGKYSLLTQASDLTPLLIAPLALTSLVWSAGTVVATTAAAIPGLTSGDVFTTTVTGALPIGYNGTYSVTVTGANTFTYALAVNPGTDTAAGTYLPPNQGELSTMVSSFFGQGVSQSVYVLELGPGDQTSGPAALSAWIAANTGFFYSYLVPFSWDASAGLLALVALFEAPTAKTYFFVTTTPSTYQNYTPQMKSVVSLIESPGNPLTEFSLATAFQHSLNYAPSSTNRMTPFSFSFLFGVTPYPTVGNGPLLAALKAASTNYVGTGAEGGISNTILFWGTTEDGQDFAWWYSADWIQVTSDRNVANAVIVGSQNPLNPLVYNQNGIDRLQDVTVGTVSSAISFGLATGTVTRTALDPVTFAQNLDDGVYAGQNVVNAVPFPTYVAAQPGDYAIGKYGGLSVVYIPQNGFKQIVFNVNVTNLLSQ